MSASTVSITANPAAAARRRPVVAGEKRSNLDFPPSDSLANGAVGETAGTSRDLIRAEAIVERSPSDLAPVVKKAASAATGTNATATQRRTRKVAAAKPEKPRWKRVVSIFTKNLVALLLLVGVIQVVRNVVMKSAYMSPPSAIETEMVFSELEGRIAEVDGFLKTTTKMMQVQVELLDKKIDGEARALNQKIDGEASTLKEKIDETASALHTELKKIESRNDRLEKSVNELNAQTWVSREELERIYEELKRGKDDQSADKEINLDELRVYARDIVEKEIEKHAADGLGRVDYALASGGAFVVKHSEPFLAAKGGNLFGMNSRTRVHSNAVKMLTPSFGEPGQCFPLKGSNGYVQVRLRAPIIPEAVTLEHVAKSVAYDRSSAPKDCRVSGWLQGQDMESTAESEKMFLLTEFTYDLDKTNAQTFDIVDSARSGLVDTVRLDLTSNHGSSSHTCIYRFRVHGREPDPVSVVPTQG